MRKEVIEDVSSLEDKIRDRLRLTLQYPDRVYFLTLSHAYLLKDKKVEKDEHVVD